MGMDDLGIKCRPFGRLARNPCDAVCGTGSLICIFSQPSYSLVAGHEATNCILQADAFSRLAFVVGWADIIYIWGN